MKVASKKDTAAECEMFSSCRFGRSDLVRLKRALNIPEVYHCGAQRTKATGTEALLIMLRRLSYPGRLCDLVPMFGRSEPELSSIFNRVSPSLKV